jgi:hypothetical protein
VSPPLLLLEVLLFFAFFASLREPAVAIALGFAFLRVLCVFA